MKRFRCPEERCLTRTNSSLAIIIRFGFYHARVVTGLSAQTAALSTIDLQHCYLCRRSLCHARRLRAAAISLQLPQASPGDASRSDQK